MESLSILCARMIDLGKPVYVSEPVYSVFITNSAVRRRCLSWLYQMAMISIRKLKWLRRQCAILSLGVMMSGVSSGHCLPSRGQDWQESPNPNGKLSVPVTVPCRYANNEKLCVWTQNKDQVLRTSFMQSTVSSSKQLHCPWNVPPAKNDRFKTRPNSKLRCLYSIIF